MLKPTLQMLAALAHLRASRLLINLFRPLRNARSDGGATKVKKVEEKVESSRGARSSRRRGKVATGLKIRDRAGHKEVDGRAGRNKSSGPPPGLPLFLSLSRCVSVSSYSSASARNSQARCQDARRQAHLIYSRTSHRRSLTEV